MTILVLAIFTLAIALEVTGHVEFRGRLVLLCEAAGCSRGLTVCELAGPVNVAPLRAARNKGWCSPVNVTPLAVLSRNYVTHKGHDGIIATRVHIVSDIPLDVPPPGISSIRSRHVSAMKATNRRPGSLSSMSTSRQVTAAEGALTKPCHPTARAAPQLTDHAADGEHRSHLRPEPGWPDPCTPFRALLLPGCPAASEPSPSAGAITGSAAPPGRRPRHPPSLPAVACKLVRIRRESTVCASRHTDPADHSQSR